VEKPQALVEKTFWFVIVPSWVFVTPVAA